MQDRSKLDEIEKIVIPEPSSLALLRVVLNATAAFSDWTARCRTYLERSISFSEDDSPPTNADRWIVAPLHEWPSDHSRFISDVIQVCKGETLVASLPVALSSIVSAADDYVTALYPNGSSRYFMFGTHNDSNNVAWIVNDTEDSDTDPTNYSYDDEINDAGVGINVAEDATTLLKKINNLIFDISEGNTDRTSATDTAVPSVAGPIIVKTHAILDFLRSEIAVSSTNAYVDDDDWSNGSSNGLDDVASTFKVS
jgi:hypothetical protein